MHALRAALSHSLRGLAYAFRSERAVRQELVLLALAVPAALVVSQHMWVRVSLIAAMLLTLAIELLNTALEKLCDHVCPHHDPSIGRIKDMGSAAVLCMIVMTAAVWGAALLERVGL
jgi:diacylglycerol kinase (ATP)